MDMSLHSPAMPGNSFFLTRLLRSSRTRSPVRSAVALLLQRASEVCRGLASGMMSAAAQLGEADVDAPPKSASTNRSTLTSAAPDPIEPAPPSDELIVEEPGLEPKFAFRSDGSVLLLVDDFIKSLDLRERRPIPFLLLLPEEVSFVQARLIQREHETAAMLAGKLRKRSG